MKETKEVEKETKNKVNKEKTKMKLWKKILIIIGIILVIFLIDTGRKFVIIRKIQNQYEKDYESTNYYVKYEDLSVGNISETWGYGNKYLFKQSSYNENGLTERMIYQDRDKKEAWIIVNSKEGKTAVKIPYNDETFTKIPPGSIGGLPSKQDPLHAQILCSVWARITTEKWGETNCYKIKFNDEFKMWINKKDNRLIAEVNGTSKINGETRPDIMIRMVKFNETKSEEVQLPDLTDYTIKDQTTNVTQ